VPAFGTFQGELLIDMTLSVRYARRACVISTEVEKSLTIWIVARDYSFWVYMVTNRSHCVLYIGVTNSLSRRIWQHRVGTGAAFLLHTAAPS
jgi:hypothetical protein